MSEWILFVVLLSARNGEEISRIEVERRATESECRDRSRRIEKVDGLNPHARFYFCEPAG